MIVKVEMLLDINEGKLPYGEYVIDKIAKLLDKTINGTDYVKSIIIDVNASHERTIVRSMR